MSRTASVLALLLIPLLSHAHPCTDNFANEAKLRFNVTQHCVAKSLGTEFAWNFDNHTRRLDVAFGAADLENAATAWVAWGLNPQGPQMVGTRALIGIKHSTGALKQGKYNITDATKRGCPLQHSVNIGLNVTNFAFAHVPAIGYYVIHATIILPEEYNSSRTHVVWQIGYQADFGNDQPLKHPKTLDNLDAAETVDLNSAHVSGYKPQLRHRLRTIHGVLNIIGWGILLPVGVIIARYLRKYPVEWPIWWFTLHVGCQIAGYVLGVIGWSIGLCLGDFSENYTFLTHRVLAILIFTFTTIQMMALRLKPKKTDEYRMYWNMYHHSLGYSLLALIAVNIFQGVKIMEPNHAWKWAYIGVVIVLGGVALLFEIFTWIKFGQEHRTVRGGGKKRNSQSTAVNAAVRPQSPISLVSDSPHKK